MYDTFRLVIVISRSYKWLSIYQHKWICIDINVIGGSVSPPLLDACLSEKKRIEQTLKIGIIGTCNSLKRQVDQTPPPLFTNGKLIYIPNDYKLVIPLVDLNYWLKSLDTTI